MEIDTSGICTVTKGIIYLKKDFPTFYEPVILVPEANGLTLFKQSHYNEFINKIKAHNSEKPEMRVLMSIYVGMACPVEIKQRKIYIPKIMREYLPDGKARWKVFEGGIKFEIIAEEF